MLYKKKNNLGRWCGCMRMSGKLVEICPKMGSQKPGTEGAR